MGFPRFSPVGKFAVAVVVFATVVVNKKILVLFVAKLVPEVKTNAAQQLFRPPVAIFAPGYYDHGSSTRIAILATST